MFFWILYAHRFLKEPRDKTWNGFGGNARIREGENREKSRKCKICKWERKSRRAECSHLTSKTQDSGLLCQTWLTYTSRWGCEGSQICSPWNSSRRDRQREKIQGPDSWKWKFFGMKGQAFSLALCWPPILIDLTGKFIVMSTLILHRES